MCGRYVVVNPNQFSEFEPELRETTGSSADHPVKTTTQAMLRTMAFEQSQAPLRTPNPSRYILVDRAGTSRELPPCYFAGRTNNCRSVWGFYVRHISNE